MEKELFSPPPTFCFTKDIACGIMESYSSYKIIASYYLFNISIFHYIYLLLLHVDYIVSRWTYLSCGDCFCAPGPEAAGMGPGWKAWLGEVVAERALWGDPWADWEGEAEPERCPPAAGGDYTWIRHSALQLVLWASTQTNGGKNLSYLVWAAWSVEEQTQLLLSRAGWFIVWNTNNITIVEVGTKTWSFLILQKNI